MENIFLFCCVVSIVWGIIWGYAVKAVIKNKGYESNWFWWGFFFGFIAFIVALTKPNAQSQTPNYQKYQPASLPQQFNNESAPAPVVISGDVNPESLLKRGFMYLEDGNWRYAHAYCDKVLDHDPECAMAYVGKLLSEIGIKCIEDIPNFNADISDRDSFRKACRFADEDLKKRLEYLNMQSVYNGGILRINISNTAEEYEKAAEIFRTISRYEGANEKINECMFKASECRYSYACNRLQMAVSDNNADECLAVVKDFEKLGSFKDSNEKIEECHAQASRIRADREKAKKEQNKMLKAFACGAAVVVVAVIGISKFNEVNDRYKKAVSLYNNGKYENAIPAFIDMNGFRKSEKYIEDSVQQLFAQSRFEKVINIFENQDDFKNSEKYIELASEANTENEYKKAEELLNKQDYKAAIEIFVKLGNYKDSEKYIELANEANIENEYKKAEELLNKIPTCTVLFFEL